ncbi:MAG: inositol phosphorylceramide synthase [Actinobacteria bacterium]|nr:inositol phosphorylceramide synthase [Actinomycetota bacterium]
MNWPTWQQALIASLASWLIACGLKRWRSTARSSVVIVPAAREFALIAALYSVWRIARKLPLAHDEGAMERAQRIVDLQAALRMPSELELQRWVADIDWLAQASSTAYAVMHVPGLIAFLIWLYWRHRERFPHVRNGLALVTAGCLVLRFVRVAPPRLMPDMGFVDLSAQHGFDLYGPVGTGVSDQFAAMPSIHVAWAAVVSYGIVAASTSTWRWLGLAHVAVTFFVVSATGNHWWLDGIVAVAILAVGLWGDAALRSRRARSSRRAHRARTLGDSGDLSAQTPESSEVGAPIEG